MEKLLLFLKKQLTDFDDAAFIRLLRIFVAFSFLILIYAFVFSGFQVVDEFEHLHASWLVSTGKIPYLDFFEHHHPLLWYLSAPIVRLFYDNVIIFYVMRAFSSLVSLLTIWYMYKVVLFFSDKKGAWFAVAFYLGDIITFYNFYQFRPDNFMNLCFIAGVYYWFKALKDDRLLYLTCSFLWFTFSVLFLQKISLLLIFLEVIIIGLIILKKMKLKNVTIAALPSVVVFSIFLFWLYHNNSLPMYFELNYHFNQALIYYFDRGSFWYSTILITIYPLSLIIVLYFFKKENLYFKLVGLLFRAEFIMRCYYFAPHPNYYTLLTILSAMALGILPQRVMPKHKFLTALIIIALFINLGRLFNVLDNSITRHNSYHQYKLAQYVHQNSDSNDLLMNGYDMNFNIYRQDVSYYWFGLDMLLPVMETEYAMTQKPDINAMLIQYRPKFIYVRDYIDLRAYRSYGEKRYAQQFIPEIVQALYQVTPFKYLAELK